MYSYKLLFKAIVKIIEIPFGAKLTRSAAPRMLDRSTAQP